MTNATKSLAINSAEAVGVVIDLGFCFKPRREHTVQWFAARVLEACLPEYFIEQRGQRAFNSLKKDYKEDLLDGNTSFDLSREVSVIIAKVVLPRLTTDELLDALTEGDFPDYRSIRGRKLITESYPEMMKDLVLSFEFKTALEKFDKACADYEVEAAKKAKRAVKGTIEAMKKLGYTVLPPKKK